MDIKMATKDNLKKLRRRFNIYKNYIARTTSYLSLINSSMILFLFLDKLSSLGMINFQLQKYFWWIVIITVMFLIVWGWFDTKISKTYSDEAALAFDYNPRNLELLRKVTEVHEWMEEQKNSKNQYNSFPKGYCDITDETEEQLSRVHGEKDV